MSYLRAVLNNNKSLEKKYLQEIITTGKKLNYNTTKYQKELKNIKIPSSTKKNTVTINKNKYIKPSSSKFDIKSVYVKDSAIVIEFNKNINKEYIKFFEQHYKNLHKDVFNIQGRFKDASPTKLKIEGVDRITISQYNSKTLRIIISGKKDLKTIYMINKNKIVIKVLNKKTPTANNKKATLTNSIKLNRHKTIVLDSGHGGKDSGAVGPNKRYEKHSVLKVSKYLYTILKKRGYKVYITRTTDRFIKVKNRTILANNKNADIFISIHANAAPKSKASKAHGIETYFLSPARSARAKRVAALENKSDMRTMNNSSQNAFLTILNQSKITGANKLAIDVQQNMLYTLRKSYNNVFDGGVREGPFWVLVGAQMPSILVEIGYITHRLESQRLYSAKYQQKIALGIANGIDSYFSKNQ